MSFLIMFLNSADRMEANCKKIIKPVIIFLVKTVHVH